MRLTAAEKAEVIRLVEGSDLSGRHTLAELGVHRSTVAPGHERADAALRVDHDHAVTARKEIVWEYLNPRRAGPNRELIATLFEVVRLPRDYYAPTRGAPRVGG